MDTSLPVAVREVNLRDGLQSIARTLPAVRKIDAGCDLMLLPLSASHAHSLANLRKTPGAVVEEIARIRALRDAGGSRCLIEVGLGTAFGCTIQGVVEESEVLRLLQAVLDAGADRVGLADTVGDADPLQVSRLFARCFAVAGDRLACGHFHNTRGLGRANVATEDVAYMFRSMGVPKTGKAAA